MSTRTPPTAVILAAGMGTRLAPVSGGLPKPLVAVGGVSMLSRSLRTLRRTGLRRAAVVVGHQGSSVAEAARRDWPGILVVENREPERTGSMRSLALAWRALRQDGARELLIVEGDLIYGVEAARALLDAPGPDTVLASTPTGAGDEVWILGEGDRILEIAKHPASGLPVLGELVGLSLLTGPTLDAMVEAHMSGGEAAALEHYEERISAVCAEMLIRVRVEAGLVWAEVDDAKQLARAEQDVLPRLES
jgi:choline kinase